MATHYTLIELDDVADGLAPPGGLGHLDDCERCREELAFMQAARVKFKREVVVSTLPLVKARLTGRRWALWLAPLALAPVAAAVLLTVQPLLSSRGTTQLGVKGMPTLKAYARRGEQVFEVRPGISLQKGDQLRFEIQPGGLSYLLMGSVDVQGNVGIIFPLDGKASAAVDPLVQFTPPGSAELDETCGAERAFGLLSRRPIDVGTFTHALSALAARGPEAIRSAQALEGTGAEAQVTVEWEKCSR